MGPILAVAKNTFKQTIRDKILYGIVIFAFLFIGSTVILGSVSLEDNIFIIRTLGLAGIYIFGLIITIFLGASLMRDELEKKTTYILLSKPATRDSIIIGKFLGLLCAISLTTILMTLIHITVVYYSGGGLDYKSLLVACLQVMEMSILISVLILFSTITTSLASTIYTILLVYVGHSLDFMLRYAVKTSGAIKSILSVMYYTLPNLDKFNIRNIVVHKINIPGTQLLFALTYAILYSALLIYIAQLAFKRKDL